MATFINDPTAAPDVTGGALLTLPELASLSVAPTLANSAATSHPAQQWWNLPAKIAAGRQIAHEEMAKFAGHHNDAGDAMRHAEWSQRMANEIGPVFSRAAGLEHEGEDVVGSLANIGQRVGRAISPSSYAPLRGPIPTVGQMLAESAMDLRNNSAGIDAAVAGVPLDPAALQVRPDAPPY